MIILGVDPGIVTTGYALLNIEQGVTRVIDFGCVQTDSSVDFASRLKKIYDAIIQIIHQHKPHVLALEEVFYSRNVKTALKMGQVRGVTILAAVNYGIPTSEYSPREVKLAVTGNGGASKQQVQKMVVRLLDLQELPTPYDVADAMAIAICHANRMKKIVKSEKSIGIWG